MQLWRSDYGPFIRYAQYSYCRRLIVVPLTTFHRLAELIGDPKGELIFLFNTARCGSTLLTQVHRTGSNLNSLLRQPASPRPAIDCFCLTGAKAGRVHCPRGVGCIPCLTCLISLLDPILHIIHSFLGSRECSPNGSSVQASCRIHRERQRPRQSVCGNNPYLTLRAVPAMPANNQHHLKLLRTRFSTVRVTEHSVYSRHFLGWGWDFPPKNNLQFPQTAAKLCTIVNDKLFPSFV